MAKRKYVVVMSGNLRVRVCEYCGACESVEYWYELNVLGRTWYFCCNEHRVGWLQTRSITREWESNLSREPK